MFCTNCGTYIKDEHNFCTECGAVRPVMPATKKGSRWVPVTLIGLMICAGFAVYIVSLFF